MTGNARARFFLAAGMAAVLLISCSAKQGATLPPASSIQGEQTRTAQSSAGSFGTTTRSMYAGVQLSDWYDNGDSATIAYPVLHKQAGGTGTYADPITFASTTKAFAPGAIVYVNYLQKYFIMEDDCGPTCANAYPRQTIVVLWINGRGVNPNAATNCEYSLDQTSAAVVINPPGNYIVSSAPLLSSSGQCFRPSAANGFAGGSNGTDSPPTPTMPPTGTPTPTPTPSATPTAQPSVCASPTPGGTSSPGTHPTQSPSSSPCTS